MLKTLKEENEQLRQEAQGKLAEKEASESKKAQDVKEDLEKKSSLSAVLKDIEKSEKTDKKVDFDNLTNQELLEVLTNAVETYVGASSEVVSQKTEASYATLQKELKDTQNALGTMIAQNSVDKMRTRFPDFDDHKEAIAKMMEETPGLPIDKAYRFAKLEALESQPNPREVESEYPNMPVGPSGLPLVEKRDKDSKESNVHKKGLTGFREILDAGIERAQNRVS